MRIVGEPRLPALTGELTLAGVSYAGHALGGGTITLTPEAKGAVRARGRLIDTIAVDGRLAPKPSGLEGEVTLTLAKLPIEPFLPPLPGKLVAARRRLGDRRRAHRARSNPRPRRAG